MKSMRWMALLVALAMVVAACSSGDPEGTDGETTTSEGGTETTDGGSTTSVAPDPSFEGLVLDSGGCGSELGYLDEEGNPAVYTGRVETITAVDQNTVEFALCGPHPAFLAQIAFGVFGIQPASHLEETGGKPLSDPIGTGPYMLEAWNQGDSVVYTRFDDYYGEPAKAETVVLKWSEESAGRLNELLADTADGITFPGTEDLATIEADPNLVLLDKPEPNVFYMGFNNTFEPYDDVKVRQAIALGIDRQRIVDTFYAPGSETASHFTPCSVENGCQGDSWYEFDLEAAQGLLADAGLEDGFPTKIYYRNVTRGYLPTPGDVATDIQAQLKENLNIDAEVVVMESSEFIEASSKGELDGIHLLGWTGDYPHVTNFLDFHFPESNLQFGDAYPEIFEPLATASQLASAEEAAPLYEEVNNAIKELVPMVPVAHGGAYYAAAADVDGAYAPPWGETDFAVWDNGTDTLVFYQGNEPISLYCADETDGESLRACSLVVQALYSYDQDGNVQPQLATECVPDADLTVWTCSLREGVLFHNGQTMTANDVVASFAAGLDAANPLHVGNTGIFEYYTALWNGLINAPEPEPEG